VIQKSLEAFLFNKIRRESMSNKNIFIRNIFSAVTVDAAGNEVSEAIDLDDYKPEGFFSLQITLTGDGTGKFEYQLSNDGTNYFTPSSGSDIVTAHTVASGPGGDGKDIYTFQPELAKYMKIKVTETVEANTITVTADLAIQ